MTKVKFINAKSGTKKADGQPFYMITLLAGDEVLTNFVDGGTFKTIVDKKPVLLKEYEAEFEQRVFMGRFQATLVNLHDIK